MSAFCSEMSARFYISCWGNHKSDQTDGNKTPTKSIKGQISENESAGLWHEGQNSVDPAADPTEQTDSFQDEEIFIPLSSGFCCLGNINTCCGYIKGKQLIIVVVVLLYGV